nr:MAG TPA: hypothetical protein [Caudoviricetes sp.]
MTEYSRDKLYVQLDALRTTLEEAVDAGDIYETPSHVYPGGNRKPAYLNLKTPEETVTITSENDVINIEDLEGVIIGNGKWHIMHALEPGGKAPLGGFILERI